MVEYLTRKEGDDISEKLEYTILRDPHADGSDHSDRDQVQIVVIAEYAFVLGFK